MRFARRLGSLGSPLAALLLAGQAVMGINLDINSADSIKNAAATAAYDMMSYYQGNQSGQIPGKLPGTWWEGGAMFMTLIQYWHWTGDPSYNPVTIQGMLWQKGEYNDYMPANWSSYLGNDDQVFWGLAAMTGAELNFPSQPDAPSWLELAQGVFNTQVPRWDPNTCHGGLRWQIFTYQAGYNQKNAISNGGLFQLAARLARYTNNQTYADWAEKIWDWSTSVPLVNINTSTWNIADLVTVESDCQAASDIQWTYNYGTYISGAAYMYNFTNGSQKWKDRLDGLLKPTYSTFFPAQYGGDTMSEVSCEPVNTCDRNMICFKGFLSSWLTFTSLIAPYTYNDILPKLQKSAQAAANSCTGGDDGEHCGISWVENKFDGHSGLEEQMAALSIFSSNMVAFQSKNKAPLTADTGGNSTSNPNAGLGDSSSHEQDGLTKPITAADRAGAGIVTAIFVSGWVGMVSWMVLER
ncbi:hypothetical protein VTN96DRAFT_3240 [Rasamsonia emersonii]|uniref:Mannan endo-1,6-alpha-mannosidase n=1 Tax=Rasamsonia emersonii (strain ATCC 16479 / CBS 393.64 / IMI 116815) TaxID=1408163 RepID=A0A0F4YX59_RASE3|nr:Glycosyl hydrolase [Rasamsonia emersonii CBS 393.64]KKA22198.1 Glycosyl hydrolase [Rasamsonia emersonii CBS 393.64]